MSPMLYLPSGKFQKAEERNMETVICKNMVMMMALT
jgi:hypothetical protein